MLYCFLDTNIFLQFKTFDEIDWPRELGVDRVCLVVPKRVIKELDKHKHDPQSDRRRKRARTVLKKIRLYSDAKDAVVRKNTTIWTQTTMPSSKWLEEHDYDPNDNDDCIMAAAHLFMQENPDKLVIMVNDDTGAYLKARDNGIKVIEPFDSLIMSDEPDPLQKENQDLRRRLQEIENAQPKLELYLATEDSKQPSPSVECVFDFNVVGLSQEIIDNLVVQERKSLVVKPDEELGFSPMIFLDISHRDYVNQIESYMKHYHHHLLKYSEYIKRMSRIKRITFLLKNDGKKPAEDVDITITFPDTIKILDSLPSDPQAPERPQKLSAMEVLYEPPLFIPSFDFADEHKTLPAHYEVDNHSRVVKAHHDNLKHGDNWSFDIFIECDSQAIYPIHVSIDYDISVANLIERIKKQLMLKLSRQD